MPSNRNENKLVFAEIILVLLAIDHVELIVVALPIIGRR